MLNRKKMLFTRGDLLRYLLIKTCICCKLEDKNKGFEQASYQGKLFKKGKKKLTRDLDIVRLIHYNRMNVVNEQVLYNNDERFLLGFHRRHVVNSDSESTRENYKDYANMSF